MHGRHHDGRMDTPPVTRSPLVRYIDPRRVGHESAYALLALPVSVAAFSVVITGLTASIGLLVVWVGVPLLAATLVAGRGFAQTERLRMRQSLARDVPHAPYLSSRPGDSRLRRILLPLRDPQTWLDSLWAVLSLATGITAFTVVVTWWATIVGGLTYGFWSRFLPSDSSGSLPALLGLGDSRAVDVAFYTATGVLALATLPLAVRGAAYLHAGLAMLLLSSRAALVVDVERAESARGAAVEAEAEALRRLERDIHDGPQQRLVRLSMDLGRAKARVGADPAATAAALDDALEQTREVLSELRQLSRGIAPPLLADRGLAVALEDLAARVMIPVTVAIAVPGRATPVVEQTVYFVTAEALTNIAKHSGARTAAVDARLDGDEIVLTVSDDGIGGAHPSKGSGLAGLARRVAGVRGTLTVDSPEGGPTVVHAVVPWRNA